MAIQEREMENQLVTTWCLVSEFNVLSNAVAYSSGNQLTILEKHKRKNVVVNKKIICGSLGSNGEKAQQNSRFGNN